MNLSIYSLDNPCSFVSAFQKYFLTKQRKAMAVGRQKSNGSRSSLASPLSYFVRICQGALEISLPFPFSAGRLVATVGWGSE